MTNIDEGKRLDRAKEHLAYDIASVWRVYDDDGVHLQPDNLRENFRNATSEIESLSELWAFIAKPLQQRVREMVEKPAVDYIFHDRKSWQHYDLIVLGQLESGEHVDFSTIEKRR